MGVSSQRRVASQPRFTPGETTPGTHWINGWVGLRAGLDTGARGKNSLPLPLPGTEPRLSSLMCRELICVCILCK
jgi:hypothetical protein